MMHLLTNTIAGASIIFGWNVANPSDAVTNYQLLSGFTSGSYVYTNLTGLNLTNEVTQSLDTNGSPVFTTNQIQYYNYKNPPRGVQMYFAVEAMNAVTNSAPSAEVTNTVPLPNTTLAINSDGIVSVSNTYKGGVFVLQASKDFKTWKNKLTFTARGNVAYVGSDMDETQRYLRVISLPFVYHPLSTNAFTNMPPPSLGGMTNALALPNSR